MCSRFYVSRFVNVKKDVEWTMVAKCWQFKIDDGFEVKVSSLKSTKTSANAVKYLKLVKYLERARNSGHIIIYKTIATMIIKVVC